jgi:RimK family alpha-L-glutamate ligase
MKKITLVTTLPGLEENERLREEAVLQGYKFELIDLSDFGYYIDEDKLDIKGLNNINSDILIVRGIFNSLNTISILVGHLRKRGIKVFDNNLSDLKYSIDKVTDLVKLSMAGVEIPKTCYTRDYEKYSELAEKIGYPVVIKSTRTGKGASVYKVDSEDELKKLVNDFIADQKEAKNFLLQEFIPYKYDLRILIIGEHLFAMRRIPGEGEFRANFSLGGSVELFDLDGPGRELAKEALSAVEMEIGGVDMLITPEGKRYIIEVNHTAGWLGMEKATGENITKLWLDHAIRGAQ